MKRKIFAAVMAMCMLLSLSACKKKTEVEPPASIGSVSVDVGGALNIESIPQSDEDGPGVGGDHGGADYETGANYITQIPEDADLGAERPALLTWTDYWAENGASYIAEGRTAPTFNLMAEGWELYAVQDEAGAYCPVVGAKNEGSKYEVAKATPATYGLYNDLRQAGVNVQIGVKVVADKTFSNLLTNDWNNEYAPTYDMRKQQGEFLAGSLRSYVETDEGVLYSVNTQKKSNGGMSRAIHLGFYIDCGNGQIMVATVDERIESRDEAALDLWEQTIYDIMDVYMSQYRVTSLEGTALGPMSTENGLNLPDA